LVAVTFLPVSVKRWVGKIISDLTYNVLSGMLNCTLSLCCSDIIINGSETDAF